jgi:hypothetical protein
VSGHSGPTQSLQAQRWVALAGVLGSAAGAVLAAIAARGALRVLTRAVRIGMGAARFAFAAATLQLLRRCPDCRKLIRRECRVCRHCGWRREAQALSPSQTRPTIASI